MEQYKSQTIIENIKNKNIKNKNLQHKTDNDHSNLKYETKSFL